MLQFGVIIHNRLRYPVYLYRADGHDCCFVRFSFGKHESWVAMSNLLMRCFQGLSRSRLVPRVRRTRLPRRGIPRMECPHLQVRDLCPTMEPQVLSFHPLLLP